MSIINRRGVFGLFGGGVAASIAGVEEGPAPDYGGATASAVNYFGDKVPEEVSSARRLANMLEHTDVPNSSMQKFKDQRSWLGDDEAAINSMKSLSPSARARMLLEIHLKRKERLARDYRRNIITEYAKPLMTICVLTQADVDTLIETGEGTDKVKMLAGII